MVLWRLLQRKNVARHRLREVTFPEWVRIGKMIYMCNNIYVYYPQLLVCVIDLLYPPRRGEKVFVSQAELDKRGRGDQGGKKSDEDQVC